MIRERFANFEIALNGNGNPIEVPGLPGEVVSLAYDLLRNRLVELHLFEPPVVGEKQTADFRKRVAGLVKLEVSPCYPSFLDGGERQDIHYFTCDIRDGELLESYRSRTEGLPVGGVALLGLELVESLLALVVSNPELLSWLSLEGMTICADGAGRLHLMLRDLGLLNVSPGASSPNALAQGIGVCLRGLAREADLALLAGLSSTSKAVPSPDHEPALRLLRADLQRILARLPPGERLVAQVGRSEVVRPLSRCESALCGGGSVPQITKWSVVRSSQGCPPTDACKQLVLQSPGGGELHGGRMLPPDRILDTRHLGCLAPGSSIPWVMESANVLATCGCWVGEDGVLVAEENCPGFSLEEILLSRRGGLEPTELLEVLDEVAAGLAQAAQVEVEIVSLHPSTIVVNAGNQWDGSDPGHLLTSCFSQWPAFSLKLRAHPIINSLLSRPPSEHFLPAGMTAAHRPYPQRMALEALCLTRQLCLADGKARSLRSRFCDYIEKQISEEISISGSVELEVFRRDLRELAGEAVRQDRPPEAGGEGAAECRTFLPAWRPEAGGMTGARALDEEAPVVTVSTPKTAAMRGGEGVLAVQETDFAEVSSDGPAASGTGKHKASLPEHDAEPCLADTGLVRKRTEAVGRFLQEQVLRPSVSGASDQSSEMEARSFPAEVEPLKIPGREEEHSSSPGEDFRAGGADEEKKPAGEVPSMAESGIPVGWLGFLFAVLIAFAGVATVWFRGGQGRVDLMWRESRNQPSGAASVLPIEADADPSERMVAEEKVREHLLMAAEPKASSADEPGLELEARAAQPEEKGLKPGSMDPLPDFETRSVRSTQLVEEASPIAVKQIAQQVSAVDGGAGGDQVHDAEEGAPDSSELTSREVKASGEKPVLETEIRSALPLD